MSSWQEQFNDPDEVVKAEQLGIRITRRELKRLYVDQCMTCVELGNELECSDTTARNLLKEAGIERRSISDYESVKKYCNEEWLKERCEQDEKTVAEIADECGVSNSTIYEYINKFGIETSKSVPNYARKKYRDKEWLKREYEFKGRSTTEIAEECGVSPSTVCNWKNKFGLKWKSRSPCRFRLSGVQNRPGYPLWSATGRGVKNHVLVHRLVMIANGADPYEIYSVESRKQVHHRNGFKCDNRPSNLEVVDSHTHGKYHSPDVVQWTDDDLEFAIRFLLNPSKYTTQS